MVLRSSSNTFAQTIFDRHFEQSRLNSQGDILHYPLGERMLSLVNHV